MKTFTLDLENVIKITVVGFIAFTLIAVSIEAFSNLTMLNRAF